MNNNNDLCTIIINQYLELIYKKMNGNNRVKKDIIVKYENYIKKNCNNTKINKDYKNKKDDVDYENDSCSVDKINDIDSLDNNKDNNKDNKKDKKNDKDYMYEFLFFNNY